MAPARRRTTPEPLPWQEVRRLDLNAQELGVPVARLMANAARALASEVRRQAGKAGEAVFFCGRGNNGGDGLAAAGLLQREGKKAWVVLAEPAERLQGAPRAFLQALKPGTWTVWTGRPQQAWGKAKVPVDCLLGSGLSGPPRPPYDALIAHLNRRAADGASVIACDIPSGLGTPTAVRPAVTVTFHAPKQGMTKANSGRIVVAPIGLPRAAVTDAGLGDLAAYYPIPRPDSHKGDNGVVLLVAGGPHTGAPYYAGLAAYRTGADLVHACMPEAAAGVVSCYGPEIMVHAVEPGTRLSPVGVPGILPWLERATALVIGPGLGDDEGTRRAVGEVLGEAVRRDLPVVVDADGLDALDPGLLLRHGHRMVLTPHSREFRDLAGIEPSQRSVVDYARRNGVTVLWKRQGAFITDGRRKRECRRGHPTMTVGGTGDVLAGAVGALLAKGVQPFAAACAGAYLVGCAGEVAAGLLSWGATATDVAQAIPAVLLRMP